MKNILLFAIITSISYAHGTHRKLTLDLEKTVDPFTQKPLISNIAPNITRFIDEDGTRRPRLAFRFFIARMAKYNFTAWSHAETILSRIHAFEGEIEGVKVFRCTPESRSIEPISIQEAMNSPYWNKFLYEKYLASHGAALHQIDSIMEKLEQNLAALEQKHYE